MKTLFYTVFTLFIISPVFAQQDQLLASEKAGAVTIGMSADEVYGLFETDSISLFDQFLEGTFSPALRIKGEGLVAELECDKVSRIKVNSDLYKTKSGLGVGSTLKALLAEYPGAQFFQGEGNYVIYVGSLHMSFMLSQEGLDEQKYYDTLEDFPAATKVAQILVLSK